MKRSLEEAIRNDLGKKIILLSGPRQVGKTTLAQSLTKNFDYLSYDRLEDRKQIHKAEWNRASDLLILDELHKMKNWKRWLKGIYDTEKNHSIIVTGSAKLETFKKMGDSLAGRYFSFHLMPLDVKELVQSLGGNSEEHLEKLLRLSGFPEPYLSGSEQFYRRWRDTHLDAIVRGDIIELESIKRIQDLATLVELMRERVGSLFSFNSLREDLQTDDKSIRRWVTILEDAYILFKIPPYSHRISAAIRKAPKYYFYDIPRVLDEGARFENLVAVSLLKEITYRKDVEGKDYSLNYARNKQKKEIDFVVLKDRKPHILIEVKLSDSSPSSNLNTFANYFSPHGSVRKIQIVRHLKKEFSTREGIEVVKASRWLAQMDF